MWEGGRVGGHAWEGGGTIMKLRGEQPGPWCTVIPPSHLSTPIWLALLSPVYATLNSTPIAHTFCSKYDSMDNGMFDGVPLTALIANRTAKDMLWHRRHVYGSNYAHVYVCMGQAMHDAHLVL